jgi:hypothetical protein
MSKLNLLFGCHYASFPTKSLGFLELFSNSPLSVCGRLSQGPASCMTITRITWSELTRAGRFPLS